jgi:hypothetical protein
MSHTHTYFDIHNDLRGEAEEGDGNSVGRQQVLVQWLDLLGFSSI